MTDTVTIAAPRSETVESLTKSLLGLFEVVMDGSGGCSIALPSSKRILLTPNPYAEVEEPESVAEMARLVGERPRFFTLTTTNLPLTKDVLVRLGERPGLVIDTQHGLIAHLHEFAALIKAKPIWDWRH